MFICLGHLPCYTRNISGSTSGKDLAKVCIHKNLMLHMLLIDLTICGVKVYILFSRPDRYQTVVLNRYGLDVSAF